VQRQSFLNSVLESGEWISSRPSHFTAGERISGTQLPRKLNGPQTMSEHFGEENIPLSLLETEPRIAQLVD
jgi:hypothetical protein